jgi:sulfur carrier protein
MTVLVNGGPRELPAGATVAELIASLGGPERGVAVAVGDVVVPRSEWDSTVLQDGERIEVLVAVQGG